jgi:hypothetical protein
LARIRKGRRIHVVDHRYRDPLGDAPNLCSILDGGFLCKAFALEVEDVLLAQTVRGKGFGILRVYVADVAVR